MIECQYNKCLCLFVCKFMTQTLTLDESREYEFHLLALGQQTHEVEWEWHMLDAAVCRGGSRMCLKLGEGRTAALTMAEMQVGFSL